MDYRQLSKTLRFALSVAVVALLCGGAIGSASRRQQSQSNSAFHRHSPATDQPRDPSHTRSHHSNGESPRPPLAQFQRLQQAPAEILRFLRLCSPWVRGMEPSPQALQIIALIQQAEEKGLTPDDYDAPTMERPARVAEAFSCKPHRSRRDEV